MNESSTLKIKKYTKAQESNKYTMVSIGDNKFEDTKIKMKGISGNNYYQRIVAGKDIFQANVKINEFENPLYNYKAFNFLGEKRNKKDVFEAFDKIIEFGNAKTEELFNFKVQNKEIEIKKMGFENKNKIEIEIDKNENLR